MVVPRLAILLLFGLGALVASACGDGSEESGSEGPAVTAVLGTQDLAVGAQRVSFVVLEGDVPVTNEPAYVRFFKDAKAAQPRLVGEAAVPWVTIGAREEHAGDHDETELTGVYFVNVEFDEVGAWGIGITRGERYVPEKEIRLAFEVKARATTPSIGSPAIPFAQPTARDKPMKEIHTGSRADPDFHTLTISDALVAGKPSVIVFATPSFCRTRTCGPALDVAQLAAEKFGGRVNFLHIEPYVLDKDGNLAEDAAGNPFVLAPAGAAWSLPSEPWVFVTDAAGTVAARFEGPYTLEELDYTLTQLTSGG